MKSSKGEKNQDNSISHTHLRNGSDKVNIFAALQKKRRERERESIASIYMNLSYKKNIL